MLSILTSIYFYFFPFIRLFVFFFFLHPPHRYFFITCLTLDDLPNYYSFFVSCAKIFFTFLIRLLDVDAHDEWCRLMWSNVEWLGVMTNESNKWRFTGLASWRPTRQQRMWTTSDLLRDYYFLRHRKLSYRSMSLVDPSRPGGYC